MATNHAPTDRGAAHQRRWRRRAKFGAEVLRDLVGRLAKLAATAVATAALMWVVLAIASIATVKIENRSGKTVTGGDFEVNGDKHPIKRLATGATQRFWFVARDEPSYHTTVRLSSGEVLSGGNLYIAWPYFIDETVRLTPTSVEVIESSGDRYTFPSAPRVGGGS